MTGPSATLTQVCQTGDVASDGAMWDHSPSFEHEHRPTAELGAKNNSFLSERVTSNRLPFSSNPALSYPLANLAVIRQFRLNWVCERSDIAASEEKKGATGH